MIKTLSNGYRQRVGIADAMVGNNGIIILYQPTIDLDAHQIIGVRKIIDTSKGIRILLISNHISSKLETICAHFIIINPGHIVAIGPLDKPLNNIKEQDMFRAKICGDEQVRRKEFELAGLQIVEFKRSQYDNDYVIQFIAS
jgi:ABC-2 type transport system ATP-binding protein